MSFKAEKDHFIEYLRGDVLDEANLVNYLGQRYFPGIGCECTLFKLMREAELKKKKEAKGSF
jgi:hypothetical protein